MLDFINGKGSNFFFKDSDPKKVYMYGDNKNGGLGQGDQISVPIPIKKSFGKEINEIYSYDHTLIIFRDGTAKVTGSNLTSQLGNGNTTNSLSFLDIELPAGRKVIGGDINKTTTILLLDDNSLMMTGRNNSSIFEYGNPTTLSSFKRIKISKKYQITKVLLSGSNSVMQIFLLLADGSVICTGDNKYGTLSYIDQFSNNNYRIIKFDKKIIRVATGNSAVMYLLEDGTIRCLGLNNYGVLGDGTTSGNITTPFTISLPNPIKKMGFSADSSFILCNDGTLYASGRNNYYIFGNGTNKPSSTHIIVVTDVIDFNCSENTLFLYKDYDKVYGVGQNLNGELGLIGDSSNKTVLTPMKIVPVGVDAINIRKDNDNDEFLLTDTLNLPFTIKTDKDATNIRYKMDLNNADSTIIKNIHDWKPAILNSNDSFSIKLSDVVKSNTNNKNNIQDIYTSLFIGWKNAILLQGDRVTINSVGYLDSTMNDMFPTNSFSTKFSVGEYISPIRINKVLCSHENLILIYENGTIGVIGNNAKGQLGKDGVVSTLTNIAIPEGKVVDGDMNLFSTVLLLENGSVSVSGSNISGCLGIGNNINLSTFTNIVPLKPITKVKFGKVITNNEAYSWLITLNNSGSLYVSGSLSDYRLCTNTSSGNINKLLEVIPTPLNGRKIIDIDTLASSTIYKLDDSSYYVSGLSAGEVKSSGVINNELISLPNGKNIAYMSVGHTSSIITDTTGSVYYGGTNRNGECLTGNITTSNGITINPKFPPIPLDTIIGIYLNYNASFILTNSGDIYVSTTAYSSEKYPFLTTGHTALLPQFSYLHGKV